MIAAANANPGWLDALLDVVLVVAGAGLVKVVWRAYRR